MSFSKVTLVEKNHTSYHIQFRHFVTLFIVGLPNIVYCRTISHLLKKEKKNVNGSRRCSPYLSYLSQYSPSQSNLTTLIFFLSWSSTSTLKDLKKSRDRDFSSIKERVIVYKHNKIHLSIPWIHRERSQISVWIISKTSFSLLAPKFLLFVFFPLIHLI